MYKAGIAIVCAGILSMAAAVSAPGPGNVLFVTVSGGGDCQQSSPCTLTEALATAVEMDEIYLASGSYAGATIEIDKSLNLYGGWDGAASSPVTTDAKRFATVLDGEQTRRVVNITGPDEDHPLTVRLAGMTVRNGRIDEDNPAASGAGINALYTELHLHNMTIENNHIDLHDYPEPIPDEYKQTWGGGLALDSGKMTLDNSIFRKNSSNAIISSRGGAVSGMNLSGTNTISYCLFDKNYAWTASGVALAAALGTPTAVFRIEDSNFTSNGRTLSETASMGGYYAAIFLSKGTLSIINRNRFRDNAAANGRGMVAVYYSPLEMLANLFADNESHSNASAVHVVGVNPFTMTNNIFTGNKSTYYTWDEDTPVVQLRSSTGEFTHNTIINNLDNYALKLTKATVDFTNNIIGNGVAAGILADADSSLSLTNTLWGAPGSGYENGVNLDNSGTLSAESGNLSGDPAFVDAANGDYRLSATSDALDAGVDAGISEDFHGQTRPAGAAPDIGADERMVSSCSGSTAEESAAKTYHGEYFCQVSGWIKAGDLDGGMPVEDVLVAPDADVTYSAAEIILFPGFRVAAPGKFRAGANADP